MPSNEQRDRLGEFLRIRRGALQPEDAGLPKRANRRLTPGLRREEVAELAGISVSWYTRLEQGKDVQMSAKALHGIAAALKLSAAERDYLLALARGQTLGAESPSPAPRAATVSATLQAVLDAQGERPAYLVDPCLNLVAWNQAANDVFGATAEPFGDFADVPEPERNLLWMIFTEQAQRIFVHWERHARLLLAQFRDASRHFVGDPWIAGLVERLTERSPEFAEWWSCGRPSSSSWTTAPGCSWSSIRRRPTPIPRKSCRSSPSTPLGVMMPHLSRACVELLNSATSRADRGASRVRTGANAHLPPAVEEPARQGAAFS